MPERLQETSAIVLDARDHGESDKIVTFFTQKKGRITGIAKGANKSKKRFVNKLELFTHLTLWYTERQHSTLVFISEAELLSSFINLRNDVNKYVSASFIREVILMATVERQADRDLFKLLCWSLHALDEGQDHLAVCTIFLVRLFNILGYCPDFSDCKNCGLLYSDRQEYSFHHITGGLICKNCTVKTAERCSPVSIGTIKILRLALAEPQERLHRLRFSKQGLSQSLSLLHRYGKNLFQREIQSWKALFAMMGSG